MSLVWKKIQRTSKKAAKFRFEANFQELLLHCSEKWQPDKLAIAWAHRRRRYITRAYRWEPTLTDPYRGLIVWQNSEKLEILTTLYRDVRTDAFEDKEWTFVVEAMGAKGKPKPVASVSLNLRLFISEVPGTQTEVKLKLRPLSNHVKSCILQLILTSTIVREGAANDVDMMSIASEMSVAGAQVPDSSDVANLNELEEFGSSGSRIGSSSAGSDTAQKLSDMASAVNDWVRDQTPDKGTLPTLAENPQEDPSAPAKSAVDVPDGAPPVIVFERVGAAVKHGQESAEEQTGGRDVKISADDSGLGWDPRGSTSEPIHHRDLSSHDLLGWCQEVTRGYRGVRVDNFSDSWRNGLAFCAIIYHFRPDLIAFDSLSPADIRDNCRKAFDAAETLGVPRLLDPNEFVILKIPDKIGILSYVHSLRNYFSGGDPKAPVESRPTSELEEAALDKHSILTLSEMDDKVFIEFRKLREEREARNAEVVVADGVDAVQEKSPTPEKKKRRKKRKHRKSRETPPPGQKTPENPSPSPLMTRRQLRNPFDSDEEEEEEEQKKLVEDDDQRKISQGSGQESESPQRKLSQTREDELKDRARKLLAEFTKEHEEKGREPTPEESEDGRKRELRQRAKSILEDLRGGVPTAGSERPSTLPTHHSAPVSRDSTPDTNSPRLVGSSATLPLSSSSLRTFETVSPRVNFYQFRTQGTKVKPTSLDTKPPRSPMVARPGVPALSSPTERLVATDPPIRITIGARQNAQNSAQGMEESTFDRVRRFGSMRKAELTESISAISYRFAETVRSTSVPKELGLLNVPLKKAPIPQSISVMESSDRVSSTPQKLMSPWEQDVQSSKQIVTELEEVSRKQKELDERATEVEKNWRRVMNKAPGSEEESQLQNEYVRLLNERNLLVRKELHLTLVEKIRDSELRFQLVQQELGNLIQIDEGDKTESHKQQIDLLMEKLMTIVNKRDELVQQLMENEQGTEEDSELAQEILNPEEKTAGPTTTQDDKNCLIQ